MKTKQIIIIIIKSIESLIKKRKIKTFIYKIKVN